MFFFDVSAASGQSWLHLGSITGSDVNHVIHVNHVVHVIDSRDLRDGAVVNPSRFHKQSMHVSWRRSSLRDNVWNHLCRKIIAVKGFTTAPFSFLRRALCLCPILARHGRVHWNIQLSPCVFDVFFHHLPDR